MGWAKLDDGFDDHPKVLALLEDEDGGAAIGMWTLALAYANRNTRDHRRKVTARIPGHIPPALPRRWFGPAGSRLADLLVLNRLWNLHDGPEGGWVIHDFADQLPDDELRAKRAAAGRKSAEARRAKAVSLVEGSKLLQSGSKVLDRAEQVLNKRSTNAGAGEGVSLGSSLTSSDLEKRRSAQAADRAKPAAKRGTRIPDGFKPTTSMLAWLAKAHPGVNAARETEKFTNYWQAKAGRDAVKVDWPATWRNWMINAVERSPTRSATNGREPAGHGDAIYQEGMF